MPISIRMETGQLREELGQIFRDYHERRLQSTTALCNEIVLKYRTHQQLTAEEYRRALALNEDDFDRLIITLCLTRSTMRLQESIYELPSPAMNSLSDTIRTQGFLSNSLYPSMNRFLSLATT